MRAAIINDLPKVVAVVGTGGTSTSGNCDWAQPPPALSRVWCLLEMACALRTRTELQIVLTERQRQSLRASVLSDHRDVAQALAALRDGVRVHTHTRTRVTL